jgi:hypothetical protein
VLSLVRQAAMAGHVADIRFVPIDYMAKTKHKSPNYPRLAFDVALDKTGILYKDQHNRSASTEAIAQTLGYTSATNGTSKAAIAALKYYGLLEPLGDGLRVSEDGIRAFELPKGDPERTQALPRMIFAPPVFADLRSKFTHQLPQNLRHALITQGYAPKAADEIIRFYRSNLEFLAGQGVEVHLEATSGNEAPRDFPIDNRPTESNGGRGLSDAGLERVLQFQISEGSDARIHFRGRPNRIAIKKLIALLDLSVDTFPV